jgi:16S rRNA processing protein RimM
VTIREVAGEGKRLIVRLEGVHTPEEAKRLVVGREMALPRSSLPPADTPDGEFYVWQLLGLDVTTTGGRSLGKVVDVFETGAHDIYVAKDEDNEYLIPAHEEVIVEVDLSGGRMLVEEIEGLFET